MRVNGPRRVFTPEFRQEAVALMERGGLSYGELSKRLGISKQALQKWYMAEMARKKARRPKTPEAAAAKREESQKERAERLQREVARLQRENARLEEDRAILKKAAAWFAKENE
jgi:transposase-like protein